MFPRFIPLDPEVIQCATQAKRMLDLPAGILNRAQRLRYNAHWRRFLILATQHVPNPKRQHVRHGRPY